MIPKNIVTCWCTFFGSDSLPDSSEVENVVLTVGDHLVSNFGKKSGHSLISVIISGDSMDHLDTVHQGWESFFDGVWISFIEWFNELFKSLEILNVILSFVQCFSNSKLNSSPS